MEAAAEAARVAQVEAEAHIAKVEAEATARVAKAEAAADVSKVRAPPPRGQDSVEARVPHAASTVTRPPLRPPLRPQAEVRLAQTEVRLAQTEVRLAQAEVAHEKLLHAARPRPSTRASVARRQRSRHDGASCRACPSLVRHRSSATTASAAT